MTGQHSRRLLRAGLVVGVAVSVFVWLGKVVFVEDVHSWRWSPTWWLTIRSPLIKQFPLITLQGLARFTAAKSDGVRPASESVSYVSGAGAGSAIAAIETWLESRGCSRLRPAESGEWHCAGGEALTFRASHTQEGRLFIHASLTPAVEHSFAR